MKILCKYSNIRNFLHRFTIIKIGKLHVRIHKFVGEDQTTLFHNHPFHYISIILKGGYTESIIKNGSSHVVHNNIGKIIIRDRTVFHRIEKIRPNTYTLFIAYGEYEWNAVNTVKCNDDGVYERYINNKKVWAKKINGIWMRGHENKELAERETRHTIYQI